MGMDRKLLSSFSKLFFLTSASFAGVLINRKQLVDGNKMEISSVQNKFKLYTFMNIKYSV